MTVLPKRNLPGGAEQWGRAVQAEIFSGRQAQSSLDLRSRNSLRTVGSQISVAADQSEELAVRETQIVNLGSTSLAVSSSPTIGTTWDPIFDRPREVNPEFPPRRALVTISGRTFASTTANSYTTYMELQSGGASLWREEAFVGAAGSVPLDWSNNVHVFGAAAINLPGGQPFVPFSVLFGGKLDFGSGGTVSFSDVTLTLTYSGKI